MKRNLSNLIPMFALVLGGMLGVTDQAAGTAPPKLVTSVATVSWTDANLNSYTPVTAQAVVEVGAAARPVVLVTKEAFRNDQTTPISAGGGVQPGEIVQFKVTVLNTGDAAASMVHLDDLLPSDLTLQSTSPDAAGWTMANSGNDLDADLGGYLAPAASRYFWIQAQVN